MDAQLADKIGRIHNQDCIVGMNSLPEGCIDLVFADPPFNIGYKYDVYEDKMAADDYLAWSNEWMSAVHRVLKPDGTFWLAIGDDFAAELKVEARKIGFHCRSWVIWYYTFGVNCKNKFTRSHTHLFHFVKDPEQFTFRADDLANRVPSARMLVYNDKRAKGNGRLPDDTWIIPPADQEHQIDAWSFGADPEAMRTFALRPQELDARFDSREDTWYIPRVAGTFKERAGFHGCQMPEQLLGRIIRVSSAEGDVVLDPFSGSASTLVTAKKMGREYLGFEMSDDYAAAGRLRLKSTRLGDRLDGSPEPTMEAFQRSKVAKQSRRTASSLFAEDSAEEIENERAEKVRAQLESGIVSAFKETHEGHSVELVLADPDRNERFTDECGRLGLPGVSVVWNRVLVQISKRPGNPLPECESGGSLSFRECEPFLFASEIAWKTLIDEQRATTLDDILCDPCSQRSSMNSPVDWLPDFRVCSIDGRRFCCGKPLQRHGQKPAYSVLRCRNPSAESYRLFVKRFVICRPTPASISSSNNRKRSTSARRCRFASVLRSCCIPARTRFFRESSTTSPFNTTARVMTSGKSLAG